MNKLDGNECGAGTIGHHRTEHAPDPNAFALINGLPLVSLGLTRDQRVRWLWYESRLVGYIILTQPFSLS